MKRADTIYCKMRLLGIDYGEKRIGIAVSDPSGILATPVKIIKVVSWNSAIKEICDTAGEFEVQKIVIGLPLNMDGSSGPMVDLVRKFAGKVGDVSGLPVDLWDERLSTSFAEKALLEADMSRKRRKELRDKISAQVILQGYLDSQDDFAAQAD